MTRRLLAVFVGLTLLVLLVHDVPLVAHLRSVERDRVTTSMERDAFTLAGLTEEDIEAAEEGNELVVDEVRAAAEVYSETSNSAISIFDADSQLLVATDTQAPIATQPNQSIALALRGIRNSGTRTDSKTGISMLYVAVPVLSGSRTIGVVEFARPASDVSARATTRLQGIAIAALISLLLAAGLGWVLARTITEPLRQLRRTTGLIAGGEFKSRANVSDGPPEIKSLGEDFNAMVDQLERVVAQQREFTGDVSHQLRTPLTTMQLRLEQILAMVEPDSPTRAPLEATNTELHRLSRTVEGLLAIARSDQTGAPIVDIDLAAVVRDRCLAWEPLVTEAGVELTCDIPASLGARAVDGAADEIIDNYIDNALECAPQLTRIVVKVFELGQSAVCEVIDDGPGLDNEDLTRAFNRFWRGEHSAPGGHGVGLAVVQRLAQTCRGEATLRHAGGGERSGLVASLRLQAARSTS